MFSKLLVNLQTFINTKLENRSKNMKFFYFDLIYNNVMFQLIVYCVTKIGTTADFKSN